MAESGTASADCGVAAYSVISTEPPGPHHPRDFGIGPEPCFGGHFVEQEKHDDLIEGIVAISQTFGIHARQVAACRKAARLAVRQLQLARGDIAQVNFIPGKRQQRWREFAVHTGQLQQPCVRPGFDPGQRLFQQAVVLAEQDGIDDGLVIEEPDPPVPQVGPPVMAREVFGHAIEKFPVYAHSRRPERIGLTIQTLNRKFITSPSCTT